MEKDNLFPTVDTHEHFHDDVVELFNEKGEAVKFNIIANLEVDDQEYAILSNTTDEEEVIIFRVTEENDEFIFESIEDEKELDAVIEAYNELLNELDLEDEEEA